jgi:hypothetical protein
MSPDAWFSLVIGAIGAILLGWLWFFRWLDNHRWQRAHEWHEDRERRYEDDGTP